MAEQKLDRTQVFGFPVDERRLCSAHAVGAVRPGIQTDGLDPLFDDSRVTDLQCYEVAASQLAIDCQIEQSQLSCLLCHL